MECGWYAYQSKSGETLFFFNKITGQYKWLSCSCSKNLEPWVPDDNNPLTAMTLKLLEHDKPDNTARVHVRSIATETDLPATQKTFHTQGTQTESSDAICTNESLAKDALSMITEDESKPLLSTNSALLKNGNSRCRGKERNKLPNLLTEPNKSYKVKLFDCSFCEKAFTSYAFLVKHEKYHVENDSQMSTCNDLNEVRSDDSSLSDLEVDQKDDHLREQVANASILANTPPSSVANSIPFFEACFQCGERFTSSDEFETHLQEHLKEQFCKPCQREYRHTKHFMKHITGSHVTQRHKCHLCKGRFLFKHSLKEHLFYFHKITDKDEGETGSNSQNCGSNKAQFNPKNKLIKRQATKKSVYAVPIDLQQHLMKEHNVDSTQSKDSSQAHNSSHSFPQDGEGKSGERHWCYKCNVSYSWSYDLVKHKMKRKCSADHQVVRTNGNTQQFVCRYDNKVFDDKIEFGKHYFVHFRKTKPLISCDQCPKSFLTFELLKKHLDRHLEEKIVQATSKPSCPKAYSCEICEKSFDEKKSLKRHVYRNHSKKKDESPTEKFTCDICSKVFNHKCALVSHRKTHLVKNKSFMKQDAQQWTEAGTTPVPQAKQKTPAAELSRRYQCSKCQKRFFNPEGLSRHKKLFNHGEILHLRSAQAAKNGIDPKGKVGMIYHCNVCKRSFKYYNVYYRHRSAHKGEKPCQICRKVFKASALSNNTCLSCKKAPEKIMNDLRTCKICSREFQEPKDLRDHMHVHYDGSFDCRSCCVVFSSAERLNKHMRNHKREVGKLKKFKHFKGKLHECSKCGKFYAGKKSLVRHRAICKLLKEKKQPPNGAVYIAKKKDSIESEKENQKKTNQKSQNYSCQKCHKSFTLFRDFYSHSSEHGEDKPCCKCPKLFASAGSLKRHLTEKHVNDHAFYCHMCSEEFYDLNSLINHIALVPGVRKHKCKECGQAFALCNRLMEHMKLVHPQK